MTACADAVGRSVGHGLVGQGEHHRAVVGLRGVGDLAVGVGLVQALEEGEVAGRADHREPVDEFGVAVGRRQGGDAGPEERFESDHRRRVDAATNEFGDDRCAFLVRHDHREIGLEIGDLRCGAGELDPVGVVVDHGRDEPVRVERVGEAVADGEAVVVVAGDDRHLPGGAGCLRVAAIHDHVGQIADGHVVGQSGAEQAERLLIRRETGHAGRWAARDAVGILDRIAILQGAARPGRADQCLRPLLDGGGHDVGLRPVERRRRRGGVERPAEHATAVGDVLHGEVDAALSVPGTTW